MAQSEPRGDAGVAGSGAERRALWSWCLYDWANSGFPTVIVTYVFSAYFAKKVAANEVAGTELWAYALSLSGLAIALASPLLGAIADQTGRRKPWIGVFTVLCVVGSAALWWVVPGLRRELFALATVAIANFAFEMGIVYYNAMLPSLVPPHLLGRLSGWGWGVGYLGGLACLGLALVLVMPTPPPFGLDPAVYEPVRATAVLVAGWFAVFSLPFFLWVPDARATGVAPFAAIRKGLTALWSTVRQVRRYRQVAVYLFAHMIYTDGLNTLFSLGGLYLAVTFNMGFDEILIFAICMNVAAAAGAFVFGWVDDWIGPKRTILIALASMFVIGLGLVLAESRTMLWSLAIPLGLFFGPAQAASRSLMARLAPKHLVAEFFGLFALSGKATAFIGPALYGAVTGATGSPRWGMSTILAFIAAGGLILLVVKEPRQASAANLP